MEQLRFRINYLPVAAQRTGWVTLRLIALSLVSEDVESTMKLIKQHLWELRRGKYFPSGFSSSGFRKFSLTHFALQEWLQVSMHGYSEWNVNLNGKLLVPVWCWSGKWLIDVAKVLIEKLLSISRRAREKSREKFQRLLKTIKTIFVTRFLEVDCFSTLSD